MGCSISSKKHATYDNIPDTDTQIKIRFKKSLRVVTTMKSPCLKKQKKFKRELRAIYEVSAELETSPRKLV